MASPGFAPETQTSGVSPSSRLSSPSEFCPLASPTKRAARAALPDRSGTSASALGELEARARLAVAVLLALDHAGIAGEEATLLKRGPKVRLEIGQRLGETVAHSARLAGEAAAAHRHRQVVLGDAIHDNERL